MSFLKNNILYIAILVIILLLRFFVIDLYNVDGSSMDYTLANDELVMGSRYFKIDRFDVIVYDVPEHKKRYIKRVIGLPGDKIEYKNDQLYINDLAYDEPYLDQKKAEFSTNFTYDFSIERIPEGQYFVLGDNRRNSIDSRRHGPVEESKILSKTFLVYWPLDKLSIIK